MTTVPGFSSCLVGDIEVGGGRLTIIGGPCLAESKTVVEDVASALMDLCALYGYRYIFKASFDKANRTSSANPRGHGTKAGLELLDGVKHRFGIPVTTDIHLPEQAAEAAEVVDLLQIPAFLCRQTDLLEAAAPSPPPHPPPPRQSPPPPPPKNIVVKLKSAKAKGIILTERGVSFGYNRLIVDMPGLEIMRSLGVPVCFDATHSAQLPGGAGSSTAGQRDSIPALARAALAVGVDALFLEVHPDPDAALSDAATQWPLARANELFEQIHAIDSARRALG